MKLLQKIIFLVLIVTSSFIVVADILVYPFANPIKEERFNALIQELRCPKCQNNNLADSNAPLAVDLKDIVYEKINNGESDEEIVFYLKERYGDFISYRPPVKPSTWLIWFGPFVILLIGGYSIFRFVSRRQNNHSASVLSDTTAESQILLNEWSEEIESKKVPEQGGGSK